MKRYFLKLVATAFIGTIALSSCQGPLGDDVTDWFDIFAEEPSASGLPSDSSGDPNASGTPSSSGNDNNKVTPDIIIRNLIGTWHCTKQIWYDGDEESVPENNYMILNADYTCEIYPYNLFEAEKRGEIEWCLDGTSKIIFGDNSTYIIMNLTSSSLILGWVDHQSKGKVIEKSIFEKVN